MSDYILFVDDDFVPADYYVYALKLRNLSVVLHTDTQSAIAAIEERGPALAILDVMMPPGVFVSNDTKEGLVTGYWVYRFLRERHPQIPVVVLTNALSARELFRGESKVFVASKAEYPPLELASKVLGLLTEYQTERGNG